jgi:hypothetical protein
VQVDEFRSFVHAKGGDHLDLDRDRRRHEAAQTLWEFVDMAKVLEEWEATR